MNIEDGRDLRSKDEQSFFAKNWVWFLGLAVVLCVGILAGGGVSYAIWAPAANPEIDQGSALEMKGDAGLNEEFLDEQQLVQAFSSVVNWTSQNVLLTVALASAGQTCTVSAKTTGAPCANFNYKTATDQHVNQKGIDLIKSFEGFSGDFYWDPVGIKTIGYGHACHALPCSGGIFSKGYITEKEASDLLGTDLISGGYEQCVRNKVSVQLNPNQFSALVSFTYNVGCGNFGSSTLLAQLNQGNYASVATNLMSWTKGDGYVLPGLVTRRRKEGELFNDKFCSSQMGRTSNSITGVCKLESTCKGQTQAGLCPGAANIKCCYNEPAPVESCAVNGVQGQCIDKTLCKGQAQPGYCPGASNIQCCLPTTSVDRAQGEPAIATCSGTWQNQLAFDGKETTETRQGVCMDTEDCQATTRSQIPADGTACGTGKSCCLRPDYTKVAAYADPKSCTVKGVAGICTAAAQCDTASGNFVRTPGYCPGTGADIQCCTNTGPKVQTCTVGGTKGFCIAKYKCGGTATPGFCPGTAADIQCCTEGGGGGDCGYMGPETAYDAYEDGAYIGKIKTVQINGKPVEKNTACAFKKMNAASGNQLYITSGFRTMAEQQYFWNCYQCGCCNSGNPANQPGYSNHQNGIAIDMDTTPYDWLAANAHKYGFVRTVPREDWHWEYRPGQPRSSFT